MKTVLGSARKRLQELKLLVKLLDCVLWGFVLPSRRGIWEEKQKEQR